MKIRLIGNNKASETITRLKKVGTEKFGIEWIDTAETELKYGISNFRIPKDEQAKYFEDILPNTIIYPENYDVIDDYALIVMKNPTRVMLWKDAKRLNGTKYLFSKEKIEWRINYSFGKVNSILNKNIGNEVFGKADVTEWTIETNPEHRQKLITFTKAIAQKLKDDDYDLEAFGLDVIYDLKIDEYLFLELNQANSLNDNGCELFLNGFLQKIERDKKYRMVEEFYDLLSDDERAYLKTLFGE